MLYKYLKNNSSGHDFFEFIYFVIDGSFTASVHKMATGKNDDELTQFDDKMRIWTRSGKFRKWKIQNCLLLGAKAQRGLE